MAADGGIYAASVDGPLRQGEVVSNLDQARLTIDSVLTKDPSVVFVRHAWAIVVTQDCDLDWDHKGRVPSADAKAAARQIPSVLFLEVRLAAEAKQQCGGSDIWKRIAQNKDERFQFLQQVPCGSDALEVGLPEMVVDFKRYFSLPSEEVYKRLSAPEVSDARRRCRLVTPYAEHLLGRFHAFQSRVALPVDHFSEPDTKK